MQVEDNLINQSTSQRSILEIRKRYIHGQYKHVVKRCLQYIHFSYLIDPKYISKIRKKIILWKQPVMSACSDVWVSQSPCYVYMYLVWILYLKVSVQAIVLKEKVTTHCIHQGQTKVITPSPYTHSTQMTLSLSLYKVMSDIGDVHTDQNTN